MEITTATRTSTPVRGIPRKPLDNSSRPKPSYASDEECALLLDAVLRGVPHHLHGDPRSRFPLLEALARFDSKRGTGFARQLVFIAAVNHRTADERRSAEFLLRNRASLASGRRSALRLLHAARGAAEMDVRRAQQREWPVRPASFAHSAAELSMNRTSDPSVGEIVLDKLRTVTGQGPTTKPCRQALLDAVSIAMEVAERHHNNPRAKGPSLIAMRTGARKGARLVTHLRGVIGADEVALMIAVLLAGPSRTTIESALLWWSARPSLGPDDVPLPIRRRWRRHFEAIDAALSVAPQVNFRAVSGVSS